MTPLQQLATFIAAYDPAIAKSAKQCIAAMRPLFKGADELIYDYPNGVVVAFSPNGQGKDAIASIALYPRWVTLFLVGGSKLADPTKRLAKSGKTFKHVVLENGVATLREKDIQALIKSAIRISPIALDPKRKGVRAIKGIAAKKRPRRPAPKKK